MAMDRGWASWALLSNEPSNALMRRSPQLHQHQGAGPSVKEVAKPSEPFVARPFVMPLEQGPPLSKAFGARPTPFKGLWSKAHPFQRPLEQGPPLSKAFGARPTPFKSLWSKAQPFQKPLEQGPPLSKAFAARPTPVKGHWSKAEPYAPCGMMPLRSHCHGPDTLRAGCSWWRVGTPWLTT